MHRYIVALFVVFAQPASAQSLSPQECNEIYASYQIEPPECKAARKAGSTELTPGGLSSKARENNIFFPNSASELDPAARAQLTKLARVLNTQTMRSACLRLVGHSDVSGPADINFRIGTDRAQSVKNALMPMLEDPSRIESVVSRGEEAPLTEVADTSKWQRRVTIFARNCPTG